MKPTPLLGERLTSIKNRRRLDPLCDITEDLALAKNEVFSTLLRDLARISVDSSKRALIINGKRYGYPPSSNTVNSEEYLELCSPQVEEIYEILKRFYIKTTPELGIIQNSLALEEKVLIAIDQLHQGGLAPLQIALIDQFQTEIFFLSINNSYILELNIDPEEILADGSRGSLLLKRRLIHEVASSDVMALRSSALPIGTNEYGISLFKDPCLKGAGCVFAESLGEIKEEEPMKIRFGAL